jgi:N-acetylglucosaminyl-diphospho-decaprenol L-rhamnosyltransferase
MVPAATPPRTVTAIIVTYNSAEVVLDALNSLALHGPQDRTVDVIVVDNCSTDQTVELVQAVSGVRLIQNAGNLGYSSAINVGMANADPASDLLILNPDVRIHSGAIEKLASAAGEEVGITVPLLRLDNDQLIYSIRRFPSVSRSICESVLVGRISGRFSLTGEVDRIESHYVGNRTVDWASGCAFYITQECAATVGGWDEQFFLYTEEIDYCYRARKAGYSVSFIHDSLITHLQGDLHQSNLLRTLCALNRVRYFRKYHSLPATMLFYVGVVLNETRRCFRPSSRAAVRALLRKADRPSQLSRASLLSRIPTQTTPFPLLRVEQ